jgi:hypothetical protein
VFPAAAVVVEIDVVVMPVVVIVVPDSMGGDMIKMEATNTTKKFCRSDIIVVF